MESRKANGKIRSTAAKVMWVGRATIFLIGLAVVLGLVFGVVTTALGATGTNLVNDVMDGTLTFKVPMDAPDNLHYYYLAHSGMNRVISVR